MKNLEWLLNCIRRETKSHVLLGPALFYSWLLYHKTYRLGFDESYVSAKIAWAIHSPEKTCDLLPWQVKNPCTQFIHQNLMKMMTTNFLFVQIALPILKTKMISFWQPAQSGSRRLSHWWHHQWIIMIGYSRIHNDMFSAERQVSTTTNLTGPLGNMAAVDDLLNDTLWNSLWWKQLEQLSNSSRILRDWIQSPSVIREYSDPPCPRTNV